MKKLEKFSEMLESAIYVILSLSALFCIGYSIYGIIVRNNLPLIAY